LCICQPYCLSAGGDKGRCEIASRVSRGDQKEGRKTTRNIAKEEEEEEDDRTNDDDDDVDDDGQGRIYDTTEARNNHPA
jgi:hypothetical protein